MKKVLLSLAIIAALASCKKEDPKAFSATNTTGTTMVSGKVIQEHYMNDATGLDSINLPKSGVKVSVTVANSELYPNSNNAKGSKTYTGTTDANGDYSISVKTNSDGVRATVVYHNYYATIDTITSTDTIMGVSGLYEGSTYNVSLTADVDYAREYSFEVSTVVGGGTVDYTIGSASVSGRLEIQKVQQDTNVIGDTIYYNDNFPLASHSITLVYDEDPTTLEERTYTTTTDAEGRYSFTVETVEAAIGLNNDAEVFVIDFETTRDTVLINETIVTGDAGVYYNEMRNENNLESTNVRINADLLYNNFEKHND